METEKVVEIKNPKFKTGQGSKGPWTLCQVITETGKLVSVFAPVSPGDVLELEYNSQYDNWKGKVVKKQAAAGAPGDPSTNDILVALRVVYNELKGFEEEIRSHFAALSMSLDNLEAAQANQAAPEPPKSDYPGHSGYDKAREQAERLRPVEDIPTEAAAYTTDDIPPEKVEEVFGKTEQADLSDVPF